MAQTFTTKTSYDNVTPKSERHYDKISRSEKPFYLRRKFVSKDDETSNENVASQTYFDVALGVRNDAAFSDVNGVNGETSSGLNDATSIDDDDDAASNGLNDVTSNDVTSNNNDATSDGVNDANDDLYEIELDPFQNFRFRKRPKEMKMFKTKLPELGTNFDLSKFAVEDVDDDNEEDEDEDLQSLLMISAFQPPTTFRPLTRLAAVADSRNENDLVKKLAGASNQRLSEWQKGLNGDDRFESSLQNPVTVTANDVIEGLNKFQYLISERV